MLGTVKVISYKEIEEARAKRSIKDALKGKGKRGRKRKSTTLDKGKLYSQPEPEPEPEPELEPELGVTRTVKKVRKSTKKRT